MARVTRAAAGGASATDAPRRGRPRSAEVDRAVLSATLQVAGKVGLVRMSVDEVAERAGVSKATIYRRWATKEELVIAALSSAIAPIEPPDTGVLRTDLTQLFDEIIYRYERGRMRDVLPHLIAVSTHDARVQAALDEYLGTHLAPLRVILEQARRRGELTHPVDIDVLVDVLMGSMLHRRLLGTGSVDHAFVADVLALLLPTITD